MPRRPICRCSRRGEHEVVLWTLADGITFGWKEMEIVECRIGEIVTSFGGMVKVTCRNEH